MVTLEVLQLPSQNKPRKVTRTGPLLLQVEEVEEEVEEEEEEEEEEGEAGTLEVLQLPSQNQPRKAPVFGTLVAVVPLHTPALPVPKERKLPPLRVGTVLENLTLQNRLLLARTKRSSPPLKKRVAQLLKLNSRQNLRQTKTQALKELKHLTIENQTLRTLVGDVI